MRFNKICKYLKNKNISRSRNLASSVVRITRIPIKKIKLKVSSKTDVDVQTGENEIINQTAAQTSSTAQSSSVGI